MKYLKSLVFVAAGAWALSATPAMSQNAMVMERLAELNAAAPPPAESAIVSAIRQFHMSQDVPPEGCANATIAIEPPRSLTGDRIFLGAVLQGQLRNAWSVYTQIPECGINQVGRYLVVQMPDGAVRAILVNLGRTHTTPTMMRDTRSQTMLLARTYASTDGDECPPENITIEFTRVSGESDDLGPELYGSRYTGSWSEIWRFNVCDRLIDVPITFTPDGDGGAYTRASSEGLVEVTSDAS